MAGRIRDEDVVLVKERADIAEIIGDHVTLRNAGGGNLKGLCPFHDEKTPSFSVRPSVGSFHCLAGETRVLTWEGPRPIAELAGGEHRVLSRRGDWVTAPFRSYGVMPLMKITMTRNRQVKEIYATDEHRWLLRAGANMYKFREVLTKDLAPGMTLASVSPRSKIGKSTPSPFGVAHGFTFGDGARLGRGSVAMFHGGKDDALLKWFPLSVTRQYVNPDRTLAFGLPGYFKDRPSLDESASYLLGWLAGYFAADGCVAEDGTVILNSARRADLEFVRDVCARLGIGTYGITSQTRVGFPGCEPSEIFRVHLANADLPEDFFLLDHHRTRFSSRPKAYARRHWVVRSVEWSDRVEEVYCADVDEGHAFVLEDNILTGNCFGCGEGGDVISFVMRVDHLSFSEAVERLAGRAGVQLRYEEGGVTPNRQAGQRSRLIDAHNAAAEFYAEQLQTPAAAPGRQFLTERGFDQAAAEHFGVGFAPREWDSLVTHLRGRGFSTEELVTAGLARQGSRGPIDRFMARLLWPIRDITGEVIGFGARRLFDDDKIEAKYVNTPETPLYKKSTVLYGVDLAKREIARRMQAVVVEGYTDVMACHLAGVETAIATCGTAFGDEHIKILRRLLMDQNEFRGEVVFTFDSDAAGEKAALRAFDSDQKFIGQTFVAVEPSGMDPCELRQHKGDTAVRDLIARRVPLFHFKIRSILDRADINLNTPEGRVHALRDAAPVVAAIRDRSLRPEYARTLAGWLGMEVEPVIQAVNAATQAPPPGHRPAAQREAASPEPDRDRDRPDPNDPALQVERGALKIVLQVPRLAGGVFDAIEDAAFTAPAYAAVRAAVAAAGGAGAATEGAGWVAAVEANAADDGVRRLVRELAVEPIPSDEQAQARYATEVLTRIEELAATRRITEVKSRLQRLNPLEGQADYNRLFGELLALEQHRRTLRERAIGAL